MLTGWTLLLLIGACITVVVVSCARFKWHPFIVLIVVSLFLGLCSGLSFSDTIEAIQSGFGSLMKYIGLIVVFGSIIGVYLEKSGAALKIASTILELSGKGKTVAATSIIGAVISIPVFCDSGFILLSGLTERLSKLAKIQKASLTLALASGLYTTHTLVPPTPGPIAVLGNLGASDYLGTVMLLGMGISIPTLLLTQYFASKWGSKIPDPEPEPEIVSEANQSVEMSLLRATVPILIPVISIAMGTIFKFLNVEIAIVSFLGNPLIALLIGALLAILLLSPKPKLDNQDYITNAIKVAGPILIITGAGGAFGGVLKATQLSATVSQWLDTGMDSEILVLIMAFAIAAILKTGQGSSTSAMVITSSLLAPMVPVLGWESSMDFALATMAIGGGAMCVSHYNDSYFWVVSQFGGMSHKDTYRNFSLMTGMMGLFILLIVLGLSLVF